MLNDPMDVLCAFPVRKSRKQKQMFRDAVQDYGRSLGYDVIVEKGSFGSRNLIMGDPSQAKYLVTAHYDTCATMPIPNLITPCNFWGFMGYQVLIAALILLIPAIPAVLVGWLAKRFEVGYFVWYFSFWVVFALLMFGPANRHNANDNTSGVVTVLEIAKALPRGYRDQVCFVLFDLEEAGLIGSSSYRGKHRKETKNQIVLNLDCVGDGDDILLFPTGKLRKDSSKMVLLQSCTGSFGSKRILLRERGFSVYPSDQANFPYGVGIAALRRSRFGLYLGRIHTNRDTILEEENVNILRQSMIQLICGAAE